MSLNSIQLNSSMLAEMYRISLVDTNEALPQTEKKRTSSMQAPTIEVPTGAKKTSWKYLGEYKKSILILVAYDNVPYLPDDQLNFLTSVLNACKLSLADVAVLNTVNFPVLHKDLQEKFKSRFTLLFGLTPEQFEMPVSFPQFQVQPFNNCTFLHTPVLETLEADKVLKSKLWVCLRKMFEL